MEDATQEIEFSLLPAQDGFIGLITLQRCDALNALNHHMFSLLQERLSTWQDHDDVHAVVIQSGCERAFCAGGDVRSIYEQRHRDLEAMRPFFTTEYHLNRFLFHFKKPYIALLNGLTLGGGVGISLNGGFSVATDNMIWGMPETKIGFFPDVGASYYLARAPEMIGWYLALSGRTIGAAEAYDLKLVNYVVAADALSAIISALQQAQFSDDPFATVSKVLKTFQQTPETNSLIEYYPVIRRCFSQGSYQEIIDALAFEDGQWCQQLLDDLTARSPLSLKVTFEQLHRALNMNFNEVIEQDLTLVTHFLQGKDFYEGVRALLVDKDQKPQWQPATLAAISPELVASYFKPIAQTVSHH